MNTVPDTVLFQILYFCDAENLAHCYLVSKNFSLKSGAAAKAITKVVTENFYSKFIFKCPYFIKTSDLTFLKELTTKKIVVIRGFITYILDISNGQWKRSTDTRRDRGYFSAIWYRGEIFAIGTFSLIAAGTTEKFNTFSNYWTAGPSLPLLLRSVSAAVLNDKLYVLGGDDTSAEAYSDTVFVYDGGGTCINKDSGDSCYGKWILLNKRLLRPRSRHSAVSFEGKIWIAGGCFENNSIVTRSVEIYDPVNGESLEGPPLTTKRDFFNMLVVRGNLYAVGGDKDEEGNQAIRTIEMFDKVSDNWKIITAFKDERRGFSTSSIGSKIYIFGGSSDEFYELNTWDAYDVNNFKWDSDLNDKYEKMPVIDCWGQAVTSPQVKITW